MAGTIVLTQNSTAVTGSGTDFVSDLAAGDVIAVTVQQVTLMLYVKSIQSKTSLTLLHPYLGATTSGLNWYSMPSTAMFLIPSQLSYDIQYMQKSYLLDKKNWAAIFGTGQSVTVKTLDGDAFTGPSWGYMARRVEEVAAGQYAPSSVSNGMYPKTEATVTDKYAISLKTYNHFVLTLSNPTCTLSITDNHVIDGMAHQVVLFLKQGTGANKVVWPANVKWPSKIEPVLSYTKGEEDLITLVTYDKGLTWRGLYSGGSFQ